MRLIRVKKSALKLCIRLYCSDKPTPTTTTAILEEAPKVNKKQEFAQDQSNVITNNNDEDCAKFEARVIKQVLIEKEQDATFQSRISKERKVLFSGAPSSTLASAKCGSIRLDKLTLQKDSPDWISYDFDQFQTGALQGTNKCPPSPPVVGKKEDSTIVAGETSKTVASGDKSGGTDGEGSALTISQRPVRGDPGKVLFTFIPEEWWHAFMPKTGVTGFGTFLFAFTTFLVSKEYYVIEHYFYHGMSSFLLWAGAIKYIGPHITQMLDKDIDEYEKAWNEGRVEHKQVLEESIMQELHGQFQMAGQLMLIEVKRENVLLQLEEEYRRRQKFAYTEVKKRLDFHVALELVKQRIQHRNLVEYVTREVVKSITPEMQDKLIYYSIDAIMQDLESEKNKK